MIANTKSDSYRNERSGKLPNSLGISPLKLQPHKILKREILHARSSIDCFHKESVQFTWSCLDALWLVSSGSQC